MRRDLPRTRRARAETAPHPAPIALLAAALTWAAAPGCGQGGADAKPWSGGSRPVIVELTTLQHEPLSDVIALTGQLEAENAVVVKPELSGVVASIEFAEGEEVKAGDVLVQLRDEEQRARLREAQAEMRLARDVFDRTQRLTSQDVSSLARKGGLERGLDETIAWYRTYLA